MDKETTNLDDFSTSATLDYIEGETTDGWLTKIENRGKTIAYKKLNPYLSSLPSFKLFGPTLEADPAGTIRKWLKD